MEWKSQDAGNDVITFLLTYSMVQSTSWEADWFAASKEIPRISRNPKVHYRTHKRPPPVGYDVFYDIIVAVLWRNLGKPRQT